MVAQRIGARSVAISKVPAGVTTYPVSPFGGDLPGNQSYPIDGHGLGGANSSALMAQSAGQCKYMEAQFHETFSNTTLNLTKWLPSGSALPPAGQKPLYYGTSAYSTPWGAASFGAYQSHCPAAGAVGAAGPATCTLMDPGQLALGRSFDDGSTGASMSLSQAPCYNADGSNNPACCNTQSVVKKVNGVSQTFSVEVCASWSGTHLSSAFCAQYGVLEVEAKFALPAEGGAYAFFGVYMFGCNDQGGNGYNGGAAAAPNCDPFWNEIDILAYNDTWNGPTYGTSLFVSKSATAYTNNVGPQAGLFSVHDSGGRGNVSCAYNQPGGIDCSRNTSNAWQNCPASPLCLAYPYPGAQALGIPASVAGGGGGAGTPGVPTYTAADATAWRNYKLVWTPTWLAWMIDNRVMRNESNAVRNLAPAPPGGVQPGYVPWRPVTLRPLIRTNSGAAPVIAGVCADATACGALYGQPVSAPAGLIQALDGTVFAQHTLDPVAGTATLNLTASGSAFDGSWANGGCSPCNLFTPGSGPNLTALNVAITGAKLQMRPASSVFIRRVAHTPFHPDAVADALLRPNSWWNAAPASPPPSPPQPPPPQPPHPCTSGQTACNPPPPPTPPPPSPPGPPGAPAAPDAPPAPQPDAPPYPTLVPPGVAAVQTCGSAPRLFLVSGCDAIPTDALPTSVATLCGEYTVVSAPPAALVLAHAGANVTLRLLRSASYVTDLSDDTGFGYSTSRTPVIATADLFAFAGASLTPTTDASRAALNASIPYYSLEAGGAINASNWVTRLLAAQFVYAYVAEVEHEECLATLSTTACTARRMFTHVVAPLAVTVRCATATPMPPPPAPGSHYAATATVSATLALSGEAFIGNYTAATGQAIAAAAAHAAGLRSRDVTVSGVAYQVVATLTLAGLPHGVLTAAQAGPAAAALAGAANVPAASVTVVAAPQRGRRALLQAPVSAAATVTVATGSASVAAAAALSGGSAVAAVATSLGRGATATLASPPQRALLVTLRLTLPPAGASADAQSAGAAAAAALVAAVGNGSFAAALAAAGVVPPTGVALQAPPKVSVSSQLLPPPPPSAVLSGGPLAGVIIAAVLITAALAFVLVMDACGGLQRRPSAVTKEATVSDDDEASTGAAANGKTRALRVAAEAGGASGDSPPAHQSRAAQLLAGLAAASPAKQAPPRALVLAEAAAADVDHHPDLGSFPLPPPRSPGKQLLASLSPKRKARRSSSTEFDAAQDEEAPP